MSRGTSCIRATSGTGKWISHREIGKGAYLHARRDPQGIRKCKCTRHKANDPLNVCRDAATPVPRTASFFFFFQWHEMGRTLVTTFCFFFTAAFVAVAGIPATATSFPTAATAASASRVPGTPRTSTTPHAAACAEVGQVEAVCQVRVAVRAGSGLGFDHSHVWPADHHVR